MARRTTPPSPQTPDLTPDQIRRRIEGLRKCIADLEAFDPERVQKRFNISEVVALEASIKDSLGAAFGLGTARYNLYRSATDLDQGPIVARSFSPFSDRIPDSVYEAEEAVDARKYLAEGKHRSIQILQRAIHALENDLADKDVSAHGHSVVLPVRQAALPRNIFVVHGHDEGARESVARFLEKIGFEAVILNERANQGRTVIEKVEAHGDVGFAVVLLTPDDEGCAKGEEPQPRARQNVLLELGYFIGKLTRQRVCTLKVGELEIPSDWRGVIDEPFDAGGGWKQTLARELQAAGYDIDWNLVMKG